MLLAIDVGNTNIVMGLFAGPELRKDWRIRTDIRTTGDELGMLVHYMLSGIDIAPSRITKIAISSVVPAMSFLLERFCRSFFNQTPLWLDCQSNKNMPNRYTNPKELGVDRIVNATAGYEKYKTSLIVIDMGTATTFDSVSESGEYLGGAISPGLNTAMEALYQNAPRLPRVSLADCPGKAIGTDSVGSLRSGIIFGYAGLVDGIVDRMRAEMTSKPKIIATGGLAGLMKNVSRTIEANEPDLTLHGIRIIAEG